MGFLSQEREEGSEVTVGSTAASWNLLENLGYDTAEITKTRCRMQGAEFQAFGSCVRNKGLMENKTCSQYKQPFATRAQC